MTDDDDDDVRLVVDPLSQQPVAAWPDDGYLALLLVPPSHVKKMMIMRTSKITHTEQWRQKQLYDGMMGFALLLLERKKNQKSSVSQ